MTPLGASLLGKSARRVALLGQCHDKQRAYVLDTAPQVSACCSRRAGKSVAVLVKHTLCADQFPGETSVYINRSVAAGLEVLEPALRSLERAGIQLGIRQRTLKGRTYWVYPNGHRIWIAGCNDRREISNFRGFPPARASIDEAQQFPYLQELIDEALGPALMDHSGQLDIIGTPNPAPVGFFFDASHGRGGWSAHHWTIFDNKFLPNAPSWLAAKRAANGWTESNPRYRREYLGEWVLDGDAIVYPFDTRRNGWTPLPVGPRHRILGVDLGSTGVTALVVVTTVRENPGYWVEHVETIRGASVSTVCEAVARVRDAWAVAQTIVDPGGLGGAYVDELNTRWAVPALPAQKVRKLAYIEHLRSDILSGLVHLGADCQEVWDEAASLQWKDDRKSYDERMPDHCLDALLYAWRELHPEHERTVEPEPPYGSPEWAEREQRRAREQRERQVQLARRANWR